MPGHGRRLTEPQSEANARKPIMWWIRHGEGGRPSVSIDGWTNVIPAIGSTPARSMRGLPLSMWTAGAMAGTAVAAVYALSAMTVWSGVALTGLFTLAGWKLPRAERQWILTMLVCALVLRVVVVLGLFTFGDHDGSYVTTFFFDPDGRALKLRSIRIRNAWLGIPMDSDYYNAFWRGYGWSSYLNILAYLQVLLGPAPYGLHLLNIGLFLTAAVMLHQLARQAYGPLPALIGLGFLLFAPSLFLWSVSALKEPLHVVLTATVLLCAVQAIRGSTWRRRLVAASGVTAALVSLETVRGGTLVVALLGIGLGLLMTLAIRRPYLLVVGLITGAAVGVGMGQRADVQDRVWRGVRWAAQLHLESTNTKGHSYQLLDDRFYTEDRPVEQRLNSMTPNEAARFAVRGPASFVLVPLPWQLRSLVEIVFLPAQVFWYGLVLLAAVGLMTALRRDALVTAVLVSSAAVVAGGISLTEGNIGTLVRHRDLVVPLLVWVSAMGALRVLARLAALAPQPLTSDAATRFDARIDLAQREDDDAIRLVADVCRHRAEEAVARVIGVWRGARVARLVADVRRRTSALEDWQCVRLAGWVLFVSLVVESMLVSSGHSFERAITLIVRGGLAAFAMLLIIGGRVVAHAWQHRSGEV